LQRQTEDRILEALAQARAAVFPARLAVAQGEIELGYHRLVMHPDGRRRPFWVNAERIPVGPVDPTVRILRVQDATAGTTRALVVNYACHPVCLGHRCRWISADYPGGLARAFETADSTPPVVCLFAQGAAGDTNPKFRSPDPDDHRGAWQEAMEMGEFLAVEVRSALRGAQPVAGPNEIDWRTHAFTFADRWVSTGTVELATATVMLNRTIGIAAVPGEPLVELQMAFTRSAPVAFPIFLGYTTSAGADWPGYIPDVRAAAEGGYGASYTTRIEVGAGERLVTQAVVDLFDMQGMFLDKPEK
jgi:hypothetical protein